MNIIITVRDQKISKFLDMQVANMQELHRQKFRLTHDALYDLHEMAYDMNEFFLQIATFPDLVVICGLKPMLKKSIVYFNCLGQNHTISCFLMTLPFSWVTSMCLHFYFGMYLLRNFQSCLLCFLYTRGKSTHVQMMEIVSQLSSLVQGSSRIPMVTDDEKGFVQAVDKVLHAQ